MPIVVIVVVVIVVVVVVIEIKDIPILVKYRNAVSV